MLVLKLHFKFYCFSNWPFKELVSHALPLHLKSIFPRYKISFSLYLIVRRYNYFIHQKIHWFVQLYFLILQLKRMNRSLNPFKIIPTIKPQQQIIFIQIIFLIELKHATNKNYINHLSIKFINDCVAISIKRKIW